MGTKWGRGEREREGETAGRVRRRESSGRGPVGASVARVGGGRGAAASEARASTRRQRHGWEQEEGPLTGGPHALVREGGGGRATGLGWAAARVRVSFFLFYLKI
jgi:hypothetical protein